MATGETHSVRSSSNKHSVFRRADLWRGKDADEVRFIESGEFAGSLLRLRTKATMFINETDEIVKSVHHITVDRS